MQPDPVVVSVYDPQTLNRYTYVHNEPINLTDRLGLYEGCIHEAMTEYLIGQANLGKDSRLASEIGHYAGDGEGGADSSEFAATSFKNAFEGLFGNGPSADIHFASESRIEMYKRILDTTIDLGLYQRAGHMLHAIEDVHGAHLGFQLPFGHAFAGHDPDRIVCDTTFINVSNEVYALLTGANARLSPKQLNELINAIIEKCGEKANDLQITRPRTVGQGGGGILRDLRIFVVSFPVLDLFLSDGEGTVTSSYELHPPDED